MPIMRYKLGPDGSLEHRIFVSEEEIEPGWVQKHEAQNAQKKAPKKRGRKPKEPEAATAEQELNLDDDNA